MRAALPRALAAALAVGLLATAAAYAIRGEIGDTVLSVTATLRPRALPAHRNAPVTLRDVTRIKHRDGSQPAALKTIVVQIDKHGSIARAGVPVCTMARLAETTPAQARRRCRGALVGTGVGKAKVTLPGKATVQISSPLSFFNGPRVHGRPSLIAHAYETLPAPKTLLVPIVIERVAHGRYGYRAKVQLPPIAEGYGSATLAEAKIGRVLERHGRKFGYVNARCAGGRLQVRGTLTFANGDFFPTTLVSPCHVPR